MSLRPDASGIDRIRPAIAANGAPSARNLLVTVFGDAIRPHGDEVAVSVRSLTALLEPFGVNERLVRTSLTRLVNDEMLATRTVGRRSFYHVADVAVDLFDAADRRIYGAAERPWDHTWTLVVIDGAEGTATSRARLRQRLAWAGMGTVAPNVMASAVVTPREVARIVEQVGDVHNVLISRSELHDGPHSLGDEALGRRSAPIDDIAGRYDDFVHDFESFDDSTISELSPADEFTLRIWLIASFRRAVLSDPLLPAGLLPAGWSGATARSLASRVYAACAESSEQYLADTAELDSGRLLAVPARIERRFASA